MDVLGLVISQPHLKHRSQVGQKQDSKQSSTWQEHQEQKPVDLDLQFCRYGETAASAVLCSTEQEASSPFTFVLLCCPTLKAQKAHETGQDFGTGEREGGK